MEGIEILLVDDHTVLVSTIIGVLGDDYNVKVAEDYEKAIQALAGEEGDYSKINKYNALVLDLQIGGGRTGADIARVALEQGFKGKIIVWSTQIKEITQEYIDENIRGRVICLQKPEDYARLEDVLKGA